MLNSYPNPCFTRLALQLAGLATLTAVSSAASSTFIYTLSPGSGDLWSAGTNWDTPPASGATTQLTFVGNNATVLGDALVNASTDDVSGEFLLNVLDLQGTGPATGGASITVNAAPPATGLTLVTDLAAPIVNLNALAGASGLTYQIHPVLTLANDATFTGAGTGTFKFSGGINGPSLTLTKNGASQMSIGGTTTLESLLVGFNNGTPGTNGSGGKISAEAGSSLNVGTGTGAIRIGAINNGTSQTALGALDLSAASGFTANVTDFFVGVNFGGSTTTGEGALNLPVSSTITASTTFAVGRSAGNFNTPLATATIPANSATVINTPRMAIGQGKANGSFTVGGNSTFELNGISSVNGGRADLWIGHNDQTGSGAWASTADFGSGSFRGFLTALSIGRKAAASSGNATATVTFGNSDQNDFNLSTAGSPLVVGRFDAGSGGVATGTLTIGHLGSNSTITSTNNSTAILVGTSVGTASPLRAAGTLNLGPGTLTFNTTGAGIAGDLTVNPNNTSTVKFNGTTLVAGASTVGFIQNLTAARISDGGLTIANNSNITIPQGLSHDPAGVATDGGLTKDYPGVLTLSSTNTYTGNTTINGGSIFFAKTASLPGFATPGRLSIAENAGLGMNVGGADEFTLAQLETYRTDGTFDGSYHPLILDTANAPADLIYTSSLTQMGTFAKRGSRKLTLGNDVDMKGALDVGLNNNGGTLAIAAGKDFSLGLSDFSGLGAVNLGVATGATNSLGTLDASLADSFSMEVSTLRLGITTGAGTAGGNLSLPANSNITAHTDIVIADSNNTFNNVNSTITTAAGGTAQVRTPRLWIGHGKGRGFLTLGTGSTLDLAHLEGGRTAMEIGNNTANGGSGGWSGTANFGAGVFKGQLSSLLIGATTSTSASSSVVGNMTLSNSPLNHLNVEGTGTTVNIASYAGNSTGTVSGTLAVGNLDATSTINSTSNGTAILIATGGASGTSKAFGALNLGGGTLTLTTTGRGISGDPANSTNLSILSLDGITLRAGADSATWIEGLSRAEIRSGGVTFDTNGHGITFGQPLEHSTNGTLAVTLTNGGSGYTAVPTVTVVGGGGFGATAVATIASGAVTGVTLTNVQNYTSAPTLVFSGGNGTGAAATVAHTATQPAIDGGLTKKGAGSLFLDASHSYTGSTTVMEGELRLSAASLPDGSGVSIATGATLSLIHGAVDTVASLTLAGAPASIGIWGADGSGAPNTSPLITGTGRLNVLTGPGGADPYDTWASQITNPDDRDRADDPDHDGFSNELEYLFGTSPVAADGALVQATTVGSNLILRWNQLEAGGIYQLQESTTMVSPWPVSAIDPVLAADQGGAPANYDRMEAAVPIDGAKKFVRVSGVED
jgi:fibronectin-binding autotransporter adhesin